MYEQLPETASNNALAYLVSPAGIVGKPCKFEYEYDDVGFGRVVVSYRRDANGRERLETRWLVSQKATVVLFDPLARSHYFCDLDKGTYYLSLLHEGEVFDMAVPLSQIDTIGHYFFNGNQYVPEPGLFDLPEGLTRIEPPSRK